MSTFREYLRGKFAEGYTGLDDEMEDAEDQWMAELSLDQLIFHADMWGLTQYQAGITWHEKMVKRVMKESS